MTAPFTFPTTSFSDPETEPHYQALREAKSAHTELVEGLKRAEKLARRSPAKWSVVLPAIEKEVEVAAERVAQVEANLERIHKARSEERQATYEAAIRWTLGQIGRVDTINGVPALRVADGDGGDDLLIYGTGRLNLEAAFVDKGSETIKNRFATIYGPDERWTRVSEGSTVEKTNVNTWSASKMSAEDLLAFATALRVVSLVAAKLDEAFGL